MRNQIHGESPRGGFHLGLPSYCCKLASPWMTAGMASSITPVPRMNPDGNGKVDQKKMLIFFIQARSVDLGGWLACLLKPTRACKLPMEGGCASWLTATAVLRFRSCDTNRVERILHEQAWHVRRRQAGYQTLGMLRLFCDPSKFKPRQKRTGRSMYLQRATA